MKKKKVTPEKQLEQLVSELEQDYKRWEHLYTMGGSDPSYSDGVNMALVRSHIMYHKKKMEELCEEEGLPVPELYGRPMPPEVSKDYMARSDEIREHARATLGNYEKDANYRYLLSNGGQVDDKTKGKISYHAVLRYVSSLRAAIAEDDLIVMRRHELGTTYLGSFQRCANALRAEIQAKSNEDVQLSLF